MNIDELLKNRKASIIINDIERIKTFGICFDLHKLSTKSPNKLDALIACKMQIETRGYNPDVAVMNEEDYQQVFFNLKRSMAIDRHYNSSGFTFFDLLVMRCDKLKSDELLVVDSERLKYPEISKGAFIFDSINNIITSLFSV